MIKIIYNINKSNIEDYPITIIAGEPDKEYGLTPIIKKEDKNSLYKNSINSKTKILENENINKIDSDEKDFIKKGESLKNQKKQSLFKLKNIERNNYEDIKNKEISNHSSEGGFDEKSKNKINDEINSEEFIQINCEENLFNKKIDFKKTDINIKNSVYIKEYFQNKNQNAELIKLLKYFDEEKKFILNSNSISHKRGSSDRSSKEINYSNKLLFNLEVESNNEKNKNNISSLNVNTKTTFFINNNISFTISSSYDNYNLISGYKLIKSKNLQNRLKEFLLNESLNISTMNKRKVGFKEMKTTEEKNLKKKEDTKKLIQETLTSKKRATSSIIFNTTNINYINNMSFIKNKKKRSVKRSNSLSDKNNTVTYHSGLDNTSVNYASNIKKNISVIKNNRIIGKESFFNSSKNNFKFYNKFKRKKVSDTFIKSSKNIKHFNIAHNRSFNVIDINYAGKTLNYETAKEIPRRIKIKRRNSSLDSTLFIKGKRKKEDNMLSLIEKNIRRTNQTLNNPGVFYNNYFSTILKEEMKEKNKKKK